MKKTTTFINCQVTYKNGSIRKIGIIKDARELKNKSETEYLVKHLDDQDGEGEWVMESKITELLRIKSKKS